MDLRTQFPRSMRTTLAGYAHLARMIDKCRAVLAGTEGEYIYPCPMDERLMDFAGITSEQFTAAVKDASDRRRPRSLVPEDCKIRIRRPTLRRGTASSWRAGRVLRKAPNDSRSTAMPPILRGPTLLPGPIFKIWRKAAAYRAVNRQKLPPAPPLPVRAAQKCAEENR